jgi:hypothetical protein
MSILSEKLVCSIIDDATHVLEHGLERWKLRISVRMEVCPQLSDCPATTKHHNMTGYNYDHGLLQL